MSIKIRTAKASDFENIYSFLNDLQGIVFDRIKLKSIYQTNIQNLNNLYLVAEKEKDVIGYISCHIQMLLHHAGKVAEIQEIFVKHEYRSAGIGKLLIDEVKRLAKGKGAQQLEVTTRVIREQAIKFYLRESFEDSHKKLVYYF